MTDIEKIYKFMDNMNMKSGHLSNVYVAKTYNEQGECTCERYGMNLMTDFGFQQYYGTDDDSGSSHVDFPTNLYVGEGNTSFDKTTSTMLSVLFDGSPATNDSTTRQYSYPLYYAPGDQSDNGVITAVTQYMICHYNENINGVTSNVVISEYGIGTSYNQLWTHSFVYDLQGDRSTLLKKPNERLVIEVYLCFTYKENVIMDGWADNVFSVITGGKIMLDRMTILDNYAKTYRRYGYNGSGGIVTRPIGPRVHTAIVNSTVTKTLTLNNIILVPSTTDQYVDGFAFMCNGFISVQPQQLTTPEAFVTEGFYSNDPFSEDGFADRFGRDVPVTQLDITKVETYNAHTGLWSESQYFNNDPSHLFDETPMGIECATTMYYTNNGTVIPLYVYQNLNLADSILAFKGNIAMIYATDRYWDGPNFQTSDWIHITDRNNIPVNAQNKRYYVTNTNVINLEPVREGRFYLKKTSSSIGTEYTPSKYTDLSTTHGFTSIENTDYDIAICYAFYGNRSRIEFFDMTNNWIESVQISNDNYMLFTYGKYCVINVAKQVLIYDLSTVSQHYINQPLEFNTNTDSNGHYCTSTDQGIICVSPISNAGTIAIIDLRQSTPTLTEINNVKCAAALWHTNYIAYVPSYQSASSQKQLIIYDVDTGTQVYQFDIPLAMNTDIHHIIAHQNILYLVSNTQTYMCDIRTGDFTGLNERMNLDGGSSVWGPYVDHSDDMMYIHGDSIASRNGTNTVGILMSNPTVFKYPTSSMMGGYSADRRIVGSQSKYVGNSLMVFAQTTYTGSSSSIPVGQKIFSFFDLGLFLRTDNINCVSITRDPGVCFIYDDYIAYESKMHPLINCLPIKITGTTKTITSINGNVGVNGKQFSLTFSNNPSFAGKPPGNQN